MAGQNKAMPTYSRHYILTNITHLIYLLQKIISDIGQFINDYDDGEISLYLNILWDTAKCSIYIKDKSS